MERTKSKEIRWQKTGGGSFRMKNRIIKPGERFVAKPEEIPDAFRDVIVPLDKAHLKETEENKVAVEPTYKVKHRGGAYYDVVDGNEKRVNEKALRRDDAEKLLKDLE